MERSARIRLVHEGTGFAFRAAVLERVKLAFLPFLFHHAEMLEETILGRLGTTSIQPEFTNTGRC